MAHLYLVDQSSSELEEEQMGLVQGGVAQLEFRPLEETNFGGLFERKEIGGKTVLTFLGKLQDEVLKDHRLVDSALLALELHFLHQNVDWRNVQNLSFEPKKVPDLLLIEIAATVD